MKTFVCLVAIACSVACANGSYGGLDEAFVSGGSYVNPGVDLSQIGSVYPSCYQGYFGGENIVGSASPYVGAEALSVSPSIASEPLAVSPSLPSEPLAVSPYLSSESLGVSPYLSSESLGVSPYLPSESLAASPYLPSESQVVSSSVPSESLVASPSQASESYLFPPSVASQSVIYPSSCGPEPAYGSIQPLQPLILNPVDGPIQSLPAPPQPLPRIIANTCSCTKTVVKPQLYQRLIQVQKNQRFLKKTYKPVVEKIEYCARPRC